MSKSIRLAVPGTPLVREPSERSEQIRAEQVRLLYQNATLAVGVTISVASILSYIQRTVIPHSIDFSWLIYMLAVSLGRLGLKLGYQRRPRGSEETEKWAGLFLAGVGLSAAGWGAAGIMLYPEAQLLNQVYLMFIVGGMMVGGASILGAQKDALTLFILLSGLPISVRLLLQPDDVHRSMGLAGLLFTMAMLITAWRINLTIVSSLELRFANQELLTSLQVSKKQADTLNAELIAEMAERQRTADSLEDTLKELHAFSYSISHDLRAPLRAINSFAQLVLEEHPDELSVQARGYLERVRQAGVDMGHLVDALLALSRLSRLDLNRRVVQTDEIIRRAWESLGRDRNGRQIELVVRELPACYADPLLLQQAFFQLLSNAIKYTRPREQALIEVGTLAGEDVKQRRSALPASLQSAILDSNIPVFYVRDNGVGFDMRYVDKLFGTFQRLHSPEEFEGMGVGLAIAQRIAQRHGGYVWAEGDVDKGATFYLTLGASVERSPERRRAVTP